MLAEELRKFFVETVFYFGALSEFFVSFLRE